MLKILALSPGLVFLGFALRGAVGTTANTTATVPQDSLIAAGEFGQIDRSHWARGVVGIYLTDDGGFELRFADDFESARGPDLKVVLSTNQGPSRGGDLGDYVDLGDLTQTKGAQSYVIPEGTDVTALGSVVIYCKQFDVLFSVAPFTAPSE